MSLTMCFFIFSMFSEQRTRPVDAALLTLGSRHRVTELARSPHVNVIETFYDVFHAHGSYLPFVFPLARQEIKLAGLGFAMESRFAAWRDWGCASGLFPYVMPT